MIGVKFDDIHSYDHLSLILVKVDNPLPEPKLSKLDIAGSDGYIDTTHALTDITFYKNRSIKLTFKHFYNKKKNVYQSELAKLLHGKHKKIIFDDDIDYYYIGRITLSSSSENVTDQFVFTCDCDPYKYAVNESISNYSVDGELSGNIEYKGTKIITPNLECTIVEGDKLNLILGGTYYSLSNGLNIVPDFLLRSGNNAFTLEGKGTVKLSYREAIL